MNFENGIAKSEIKSALEQVLQWKGFTKSPTLTRFLRFVVEKKLDGHADQIKEYTVGVSVFAKPHGFNPQTDASVRISAIRLRKVLDEYYQENEHASDIRIHLTKGSYCPEFLKAHSGMEPLPTEHKVLPTKLPADSICVVPFTGLFHEGINDFSIEGFSAFLSEKLSHFQDIQVKSFHSVTKYLHEGGQTERLGSSLKVTYYLGGSLEIEEERIQVTVNLFEAMSNTLIWSQEFLEEEGKDSFSVIMEQIVSKIVASLAGYSGLIHYKNFSLDIGEMPSLNNSQAVAVFWFYHFQTRLSEKTFYKALQHLEKATQESPDCDLCWTVLAHLYANSIIYNFQAGQGSPLAKAQAYLARAFSINSSSQQGYITLAWINIFLRNKEAAIQALEKADKINPNSSYAKAVCSLGMSFLGEYEKSHEWLEQAMPLHPLPYWWFNLPSIYMALKAKDFSKMLFYSRKVGTPAGIHEHIFEMIALYYLEETVALQACLKEYLQKYPEGIEHAIQTWPKILFDESLIEQILVALTVISQVKQGSYKLK